MTGASVKIFFSSFLVFSLAATAWAASEGNFQPSQLAGLSNQHDKPFAHEDSVEVVLFVKGMKSKNLVRDALADIDQQCLHDGRVVYVANISKMPKMISKTMAIPRMRKLPYPVWLDRTGDATANLPAKKKQVTFLRLASDAQPAAEYFSDSARLASALKDFCQ